VLRRLQFVNTVVINRRQQEVPRIRIQSHIRHEIQILTNHIRLLLPRVIWILIIDRGHRCVGCIFLLFHQLLLKRQMNLRVYLVNWDEFGEAFGWLNLLEELFVLLMTLPQQFFLLVYFLWFTRNQRSDWRLKLLLNWIIGLLYHGQVIGGPTRSRLFQIWEFLESVRRVLSVL